MLNLNMDHRTKDLVSIATAVLVKKHSGLNLKLGGDLQEDTALADWQDPC